VLKYHKFQLENGLKVVVHEDNSTPMAALNLLYDVGARDESPAQTGLAHLFEHLMFSGSANIKDMDTIVQNAGGENNAFTNNDHTNFHEIFPAQNIETAFWIEADRMLSLKLNKKSLETQKKVVIEEFKETTLNEPFGDVWHHLSEMVYKKHPYRWPVIGLIPEHIENVTLEDAMAFYQQYYQPNNAILAVSGNVKVAEIKEMAEKWFGDIPSTQRKERYYPKEESQKEINRKSIEGKSPVDAIYMAFRMVDRLHPDFYVVDLISDILSNGQSSRLYLNLLKNKRIFNTIDAYISGFLDPGLLLIEGKLNQGVTLETAEAAIWEELNLLKTEGITPYELQKNKNQVESALIFSESGTLNKAINLAFYESIGNIDLINTEMEDYSKVTPEAIQRVANEMFIPENCSILCYVSN
jgi:zinc protease